MSHVVFPVQWGQILRMDISGKSSVIQSESIPNSRIWKSLGGPHVSCGSSLAIRPNFDVWMSPANRKPNNWNQRQTAGFGSLRPFLISSRKFRRVAQTSFSERGTTCAMWSPPFAIGPNFDVWISPQIECQTVGINAK